MDRSPFLDQLYAMNDTDKHSHEHHGHPHHDEPEITDVQELPPRDRDHLKLHTLRHLAHGMCKHSIPCDDGCQDDIDKDIDIVVGKYFNNKSDQLLQYFADTKNTVTDIIRIAMDEAMEDVRPLTADNDEFVQTVVERVTDSEDVGDVIKTIKGDIKKHAEEDIRKIVDDIKDDEDENNPQQVEDPTMESIFHHYLIQAYQESQVPDDMEALLVMPMIETAFHYVRKVLFNDGYERRA